MSAFDLAGVAALLGVVGAGLKYLLTRWFGREGEREAELSRREKDWMHGVEARLNKIEKAYGVVVGIVHVWIDEIGHDSPSLPVIAAQLKEAFPVDEEIPTELRNLVLRLETKQRQAPRRAVR